MRVDIEVVHDNEQGEVNMISFEDDELNTAKQKAAAWLKESEGDPLDG